MLRSTIAALIASAATLGVASAATLGVAAPTWAAPAPRPAAVPLSSATYISVQPERLLDTRPGPGQIGYSGPKPFPGQTVTLAATGAGVTNVPADAEAVVLDITGSEATADGFVTVWPCDQPRPTASNLNLAAGGTTPNLVITKLGTVGTDKGHVCIFTQNGTHLIADINGYFPAKTAFVSVQPERLLDTRPGSGQIGYSGDKPAAGQTVSLAATGADTTKVPDDAAAVVLNITGTDATDLGFVTVWPCGQPRPTASSLNLVAGGTTPNLVISKLGTTGADNGRVCIFTQNGAHLVADIDGYFPANTPYVPVQPERLLDTRKGPGQVGYSGAKPTVGQTVQLRVVGVGATNVPVGAPTVVLNVTGTDAKADGFVTVWPCDQPRPTASNLNLTTGSTAASLVISKLAADGSVCLFTQSGTDLVADISGYFTPNGPITNDFVAGGTRPATVHVPPGYNPSTATPLLIMLHGYSASAAIEEGYLRLAGPAAAQGMLYVYPDGTKDALNNRFWNATDACCDIGRTGVDDSGYLSRMITQIAATVNVDPKRIFVVGHSNGGFMSYRMACDHADQVAAIVSLEAATFNNPASCKPSKPVSVLEIHGTSDRTIAYNGGSIVGVAYPSAPATVSTWATYDGCSATPDPTPAPHQITTNLAPATVTSYSAGCAPGGHAELWTVPNGPHIPALSADFATQVITFLLAHPKP